jgi:phenylacetate-CoA ligase
MTERKFWNPKIEAMPWEEMRKLQLERLIPQIEHVYRNVPFYRRSFERAKVTPDEIKTLEDLRKVPLTIKDEWREAQMKDPPFGGLLGVPLDEVANIYGSTGTTGEPTYYAYTREDIEILAEQYGRIFWSWGTRHGDIVFMAFDTWHGVTAPQHRALHLIGAEVIPTTWNPDERMVLRNLKMIERLNPGIFLTTPAYYLQMARVAADKGINLRKLGEGKIAGTAGEAATPASTRMIREPWDFSSLFWWYGQGDSRTMAYECYEHNGYHLCEDNAILEILDLDTKEPIKPGELGEIAITTLNKKASPFVRFRTEDIGRINEEPCPCGRTSPRLTVLGRVSERLKIKGKAIMVQEIEVILSEFPELRQFQVLLDRPATKLEKLNLKVEYTGGKPGLMKSKIEERLGQELGVGSEVELVSPGEIPAPVAKHTRLVKV